MNDIDVGKAVKDLLFNIEQWCAYEGWGVNHISACNDGCGAVELEVTVETQRTVNIKPIAGKFVKADARVDITGCTTGSRMLVMLVDGEWQIQVDARVRWPIKWGRECFVDLIKRLY